MPRATVVVSRRAGSRARPRVISSVDGARRRGPRCAGRAPSAASTAASTALASASIPSPSRSIIATERNVASGLAAPVPAMSGAEPWTGSNTPGPPSPRLADGSIPSEPVSIADSSLRMSPNMFSVRITSKRDGSATSCIAALSTSRWSSSTSGVVGGDPRHHLAPQPRGLEHVRLVDRGHPAATARGRLEADLGDPLDLRRPCRRRCRRRGRRRGRARRSRSRR